MSKYNTTTLVCLAFNTIGLVFALSQKAGDLMILKIDCVVTLPTLYRDSKNTLLSMMSTLFSAQVNYCFSYPSYRGLSPKGKQEKN